MVFRTNILNPKTRKTLQEAKSIQMDLHNREIKSTSSNILIKQSLSPTVSKNPLSNAAQGKTYVSVEKLPICGDQQNQLKETLNLFSSCDTSVLSDADEKTQYNEKKHKTKRKEKDSVVESESNLNKESGYDSVTTSQSNTDSNTSEEDQEASSEEDNDCGVNMPAHHLQITYKFIQTETKLLRKIFNVHGLTEVQSETDFNLLWTGVHMKLDTLRNLALYQRVNHFPR